MLAMSHKGNKGKLIKIGPDPALDFVQSPIVVSGVSRGHGQSPTLTLLFSLSPCVKCGLTLIC